MRLPTLALALVLLATPAGAAPTKPAPVKAQAATAKKAAWIRHENCPRKRGHRSLSAAIQCAAKAGVRRVVMPDGKVVAW